MKGHSRTPIHCRLNITEAIVEIRTRHGVPKLFDSQKPPIEFHSARRESTPNTMIMLCPKIALSFSRTSFRMICQQLEKGYTESKILSCTICGLVECRKKERRRQGPSHLPAFHLHLTVMYRTNPILHKQLTRIAADLCDLQQPTDLQVKYISE